MIREFIIVKENLERVQGDYGYMDSTGNYHYYIKDYQGNVRAVIDQQGTLEEVNNYYPYGALLGGGTLGGNQGVQPYKYGTKELDRQNGLDWYDSQARMYDPLLGRTPTIDPKAEEYTPISPYAWCAGNPILFIDPDGNKLQLLDNYKDGAMYIGKIAATSYGRVVLDRLIGEPYRTYRAKTSYFTLSAKFDPNDNLTFYYPKNVSMWSIFTDYVEMTPFTSFSHEAFHAYDFSIGNLNYVNTNEQHDIGEERAVSFENYIRQSHGLDLRKYYSGMKTNREHNYFQFSATETISDFQLLHSSSSRTYGFSYLKTTKQNDSQKEKSITKKMYIIVRFDQSGYVTYNIYDNAKEFFNAISNK